jgi:hypothetical protein
VNRLLRMRCPPGEGSHSNWPASRGERQVVLDGLFSEDPDRSVGFHEAGEPGSRVIQRLQQTLRHPMLRLFLRRGLLDEPTVSNMKEIQPRGLEGEYLKELAAALGFFAEEGWSESAFAAIELATIAAAKSRAADSGALGRALAASVALNPQPGKCVLMQTLQGEFRTRSAAEAAKARLVAAGIDAEDIKLWNIISDGAQSHSDEGGLVRGAAIGGIVAGLPGLAAGAALGVSGGQAEIPQDNAGVRIVVRTDGGSVDVSAILSEAGAANVRPISY